MPHQFSAQAQVIRDLFINLVLLNHEEGNDLVDSALGIRTVPTIGQILHPNNSTQALIFNLIIGEEAQIEDCLAWVLSQRYLDTRSPGRFRDKYDLALLFDARDADFKQAVRTTKEGFCWVMEKIFLHPIFYNNSNRHQLPIAHQLALTLERLGSNGNGALVGRFSRNLGVGRGTVVKVTRRVLCAINSLSPEFVVWPNKERRQEISQKMKVCTESEKYFDEGQYLLADSAYALSSICIPAYKAPTANIPANTEFNYCIAKSRIIRWINGCVTLHNMLACLGDSWDDMAADVLPAGGTTNKTESNIVLEEEFCAVVQGKCLEVNYARGILPIPS
ncbi:hypothetical protein PCANC_23382 [Puccinia coronata f. sp. avenae]|uniref:DDE Tnp4 domain-containing protein n=1 Tax=Puccinia coronata f. sp. avenae TaxID=200324 RepID=A0A2N5SGM1_9BASI|nr:hypothetical protein PCANC_23382 [Puccinia coronata f. sp. avenae]